MRGRSLIPFLVILLICGCVNQTLPTTTSPPITINLPEDWCGWSTNAECSTNSDCSIGGCSGQVCRSVNESSRTTCEWLDCYDDVAYDVECGCYNGECQWNSK